MDIGEKKRLIKTILNNIGKYFNYYYDEHSLIEILNIMSDARYTNEVIDIVENITNIRYIDSQLVSVSLNPELIQHHKLEVFEIIIKRFNIDINKYSSLCFTHDIMEDMFYHVLKMCRFRRLKMETLIEKYCLDLSKFTEKHIYTIAFQNFKESDFKYLIKKGLDVYNLLRLNIDEEFVNINHKSETFITYLINNNKWEKIKTLLKFC